MSVEGDRCLDSDVVFGVRDTLIEPFEQKSAGEAADGRFVDRLHDHLHYEFGLKPVGAETRIVPA